MTEQDIKRKVFLGVKTMEANKIVLTVDECADTLRISRPQAYLGIKRGEIPFIKVGRRILIPRAALEKLLTGKALT